MNITVKSILILLSVSCICLAQRNNKREIPTEFQNHIIYALPETVDGNQLRFLTDTGGGTFMYGHALDKLKIEGIADLKSIPMPRFNEHKWIPEPISVDGKLFIYRGSALADDKEQTGMMGAFWFADHTWFFDYQNRKLYLMDGYTGSLEQSSTVPIYFQKNDQGKKTTHFPRIKVEIDGETVEMLFDTGAQVNLSEAAQNTLADGRGKLRATSFIIDSIFKRWHSKHPDWQILEGADSTHSEDMIRVPSVTIAKETVGPVWFTRRADKNFHEYMSQWMDKQVSGAIGGSAFQYFNIIVDYPNERAVFMKIENGLTK